MVSRSSIEPQDTALRRHMLIAGTGRAGTSFLVRYLSALGLETEIERSGKSQWNEMANAGLETMPLLKPGADLPYVIKTPWIAEFADHILKQDAVAIDALIIPIRDLNEAAASRTILELRAIHERMPWMAELDSTHDVGLDPRRASLLAQPARPGAHSRHRLPPADPALCRRGHADRVSGISAPDPRRRLFVLQVAPAFAGDRHRRSGAGGAPRPRRPGPGPRRERGEQGIGSDFATSSTRSPCGASCSA